MDQFLSKLNLQNLLRQFCCGVVFFVPLYLFTPYSIRGMMCAAGIEKSSITCVAVLAFIIGTFIYHWEKNLYSYPIQVLHKKCDKWSVLILMVPGIFLCISIYFQWSTIIYILLAIFGIAWFVGICLLVFRDAIIECTEKCWKIEGGAEGVTKEQQAIAQKVSVWADFIHCVQSSCFAWILGTVTAYYFHQCHEYVCCEFNCLCIQRMCNSIIIAISILLVEIAIDAHRYIHVKKMIDLHKRVDIHIKYSEISMYDLKCKNKTRSYFQRTTEL